MYAYQARLYCDECGKNICGVLLNASDTEDNGDSDTYPQYSDEACSETDCPSHCAECAELLEENLTTYGRFYVCSQIVSAIGDDSGRWDILNQWIENWDISLEEVIASLTK